MGIDTFGISLCTLEQVFINVTNNVVSEHNTMDIIPEKKVTNDNINVENYESNIIEES